MLSRGDGVLCWKDQPGIVDIGLPLKRRADAFLELPTTDPDVVRRLFTLRLAQVAQVGEPVRRLALKSECTPAEWSVAEQLAGSDQRPALWRLIQDQWTFGFGFIRPVAA